MWFGRAVNTMGWGLCLRVMFFFKYVLLCDVSCNIFLSGGCNHGGSSYITDPGPSTFYMVSAAHGPPRSILSVGVEKKYKKSRLPWLGDK